MHLTCIGVQPRSPRASVSSPAPSQPPFSVGIRPIQPVMHSRRLSAAGFRLLGHLLLAEDFRPLCSRPTRLRWTSSRLSRSAPIEIQTGWVPSILRGRGVRAESRVLLGSLTQNCRVNHPSATFNDGASTKIHLRSPVRSFPCPDRLDGSNSPWASPPASHPTDEKCRQDACGGWEQAVDTRLSLSATQLVRPRVAHPGLNHARSGEIALP